MKLLLFLILSILCASCQKKANITSLSLFVEGSTQTETITTDTYINSSGMTIQTRYKVPSGYKRKTYTDKEFGYHLQNLPLKAYGEKVKYHNGTEKNKPQVYSSVVDLPIGTKDLHQCADATMRLRADFLYQQKRYNEIVFLFNDGKPRFYTDYVQGDFSKAKYWTYLEHIFMYANTASLKQQLQSISKTKVQIGDILLQSGKPYGHAVIVVDMAQNEAGNTLVLLAQSYMPAQELQILKNPYTQEDNPWYEVTSNRITTPEWRFTSADWKTW